MVLVYFSNVFVTCSILLLGQAKKDSIREVQEAFETAELEAASGEPKNKKTIDKEALKVLSLSSENFFVLGFCRTWATAHAPGHIAPAERVCFILTALDLVLLCSGSRK